MADKRFSKAASVATERRDVAARLQERCQQMHARAYADGRALVRLQTCNPGTSKYLTSGCSCDRAHVCGKARFFVGSGAAIPYPPTTQLIKPCRAGLDLLLTERAATTFGSKNTSKAAPLALGLCKHSRKCVKSQKTVAFTCVVSDKVPLRV